MGVGGVCGGGRGVWGWEGCVGVGGVCGGGRYVWGCEGFWGVRGCGRVWGRRGV